MVGGLSFIVDFTLLVILTEIVGFHYLISAPIAFILSLTFNYFFCIKWVFGFRRYSSIKTEFGIFCMIGLAGVIITEIMMAVLTPLMDGNYPVAKIASAGVVLFWNFFLRRQLLFKPNNPF